AESGAAAITQNALRWDYGKTSVVAHTRRRNPDKSSANRFRSDQARKRAAEQFERVEERAFEIARKIFAADSRCSKIERTLKEDPKKNLNLGDATFSFAPFLLTGGCTSGCTKTQQKLSNRKGKGNMKLDSLKTLYVNELRDLYNAENQLVKALPKMAKGASSDDLKEAFEKHLEQTKGHVQRLEQVFQELGGKAKGKTCQAMKGLIEEGSEVLKADGEDSVIDAAIIVAAQKVEHYEIAGYGSVRTFAQLLGQDKSAELLQQTLDEESEANELLNKLAEDIVNPEALMEPELASASSDR